MNIYSKAQHTTSDGAIIIRGIELDSYVICHCLITWDLASELEQKAEQRVGMSEVSDA